MKLAVDEIVANFQFQTLVVTNNISKKDAIAQVSQWEDELYLAAA